MIDFIIKSTVSLFLLLAVYQILLEKEKIHQFNRFYLLFSLVFSLSIPFITIEVIQESIDPLIGKTTIQPREATITIIKDSMNYWIISIWSLYALVTSVLIIRFVTNIRKLTSRIKSNPVIDYKKAKLVLLKDKILPHTFLDTIFINETDYYNRKIEAELYTHELIHVTQKHTLDILLVEILKMLFWFNPIFIYYKKAIQLNHEFIADEKVVNSYNNVPFYQNLLLSVANANSNYYLASNLNYSITKKRLIMMTKTTSASRAMLKKLVLMPLFSGLVFFMCVKTVAQEKKVETKINSATPVTGIEKYFENTIFKITDANGNIISEKEFNQLTTQEKKNIPPPPPPATVPTSEPEKNKRLIEQKNAVGPKYIELMVNNSDTDTVYNVAETETKPTFPGGMNAFYKFVAENFKVSDEASKMKLKGKVYITFLIEKDGSLSEFRILRDMGYGTGEEAIRVLKLSPNWIPATFNNKPARVSYNLPITIETAK
ncbi:M56 family metallopeptidase [Flavobacterium frigoris]|uniref:Regulatory sensor-transducer, BlaR1/MecR1 family n=1 Tax=Flavobacterium frigoris (strain PS1) TaxID=1086011 RepID=H7FP97_FLAFP|nr:M56 family metallopeptidase [Flavobacterium frigoris]EIA09577.1 regulatory sensor-transducer, BlaR1/MecR1 family [Flavobacterium frigoris PS1]